MRKLIMVLFVVLFSFVVTNAQVGTVGWQRGFAADTLGNAQLKTSNWVNVPEEACSVIVVVLATGELDTDQLIFKRGFFSKRSGVDATYAVASGDTTTLTLNLAAGAFGVQKSTKYLLDGVNKVQATVLGAAAGCDPTDPNAVEIWFQFLIDTDR